MMSPWTVVTPPRVHSSAGITALHQIAEALRETGREVRIAIADCVEQHVACPDLKWARDSIVLMPETVLGNPLEAPRLARWYGSRPGFCNTAPLGEEPGVFVAVQSQHCHPKPNQILRWANYEKCFHEHQIVSTHRGEILGYEGKGPLFGPIDWSTCPRPTTMLTREWPPTQEHLAELLRSATHLITWDADSALIFEAIICGCVPFIARYAPWTRDEVLSFAPHPTPVLDADHLDMTLTEFATQREELLSCVEVLQRTWTERVAAMASAAEAFFEVRP